MSAHPWQSFVGGRNSPLPRFGGAGLSKTVGGTPTTYLQDVVGGLPRVLVESTGGENTLYVYGLGLALEVRPDGTHRYYHSDALGSKRVVTDDGGQRRGG